jgi:hypothetical protein
MKPPQAFLYMFCSILAMARQAFENAFHISSRSTLVHAFHPLYPQAVRQRMPALTRRPDSLVIHDGSNPDKALKGSPKR